MLAMLGGAGYSQVMMRAGLLVWWAALACSRVSSEGSSHIEPLASKAAPAEVVAAIPISSAASLSLPPGGQWPELVREGEWQLALQQLAALPEAERATPLVRLATGLVALKAKDFQVAQRALMGLEHELPLHATRIEHAHALAALEVGPYDVAARYLERSKLPDAQSSAALAWLKHGNPTSASRVISEALATKGKRFNEKQTETHARYVRAKIALARGTPQAARSDLLWVLLSEPASSSAEHSALDWTAANLPALTKQERLQRAERFADRGDLTAAQKELELLAAAPGAAPSEVAVTRVRALAYYNSRVEPSTAAELYRKAADLDAKDRPQLLLYAARSWSRAGRSQEAIAQYTEIAQRYSALSQGEEARYLLARLHSTLADWTRAEQTYSDILKAKSKSGKSRSRFQSSIVYERAVTRLAMGKDQLAAVDFAALAKSEEDPKERARLLELLGASLSKHDAKKASIALREAIALWPLSLPAELARIRLQALGETPPAVPPTTAALPPTVAAPLHPAAEQLHRIGLDREASLVVAAHERALVKAHAPRGVEAVCDLQGELADGHQRYRFGRAQIKTSALLSTPKAETLWAWNCLYPRPHRGLVTRWAEQTGIAENLVYAVMRRESAFNVEALSPAGARGLMQLMPRTAQRVGEQAAPSRQAVDLSCPADNIELGTRYLKVLTQTFAGQVPLVLAAYNAGPLAVSQWLEHGESLPLDVWLARIPYSETRSYVTQVMTNYIRYAWLSGGNLPTIALALPQGLRAAPDAY
ncbi:MAG TPA: transglycosylase SLT domain-containing protein [Polyangiaceae bacterium]|nr:transglycosylase SLT domain-containing protein [Polyangiaceae bacterium]